MKTLILFALSVSPALANDFASTCRTLGQVGQCRNVTFCAERHVGQCVPKPAQASDPQWQRACNAAGPDAKWCGYQAFCEWQEGVQCVPRQ